MAKRGGKKGKSIRRALALGYDPDRDKRLFTLSPSGLTLIPTGLPSEEGFSVQPLP